MWAPATTFQKIRARLFAAASLWAVFETTLTGIVRPGSVNLPPKRNYRFAHPRRDRHALLCNPHPPEVELVFDRVVEFRYHSIHSCQ